MGRYFVGDSLARGKRNVADWFSGERFLAKRGDSWAGGKKFEVTEKRVTGEENELLQERVFSFERAFSWGASGKKQKEG